VRGGGALLPSCVNESDSQRATGDGVAEGVRDRKWRAACERVRNRLAVDQSVIIRGILTFECNRHLAENATKAGEAKAYGELHAVVRAVERRRLPASP
jgi:hypothetical protein